MSCYADPSSDVPNPRGACRLPSGHPRIQGLVQAGCRRCEDRMEIDPHTDGLPGALTRSACPPGHIYSSCPSPPRRHASNPYCTSGTFTPAWQRADLPGQDPPIPLRAVSPFRPQAAPLPASDTAHMRPTRSRSREGPVLGEADGSDAMPDSAWPPEAPERRRRMFFMRGQPAKGSIRP
jgi:hypothetical protein